MVVLSSECLYGYLRIVEIGHAMVLNCYSYVDMVQFS